MNPELAKALEPLVELFDSKNQEISDRDNTIVYLKGQLEDTKNPQPELGKLELKLTSPEKGVIKFDIKPYEQGRVYTFVAADSTKPEGGDPITLAPSMLWGDGKLNPDLTFRIKVFTKSAQSDWVAISADGQDNPDKPVIVKPNPLPESPPDTGKGFVTNLKLGRFVRQGILSGSGVQPAHPMQGAFNLAGNLVSTWNGTIFNLNFLGDKLQPAETRTPHDRLAIFEWSKNPSEPSRAYEFKNENGRFYSSIEGSCVFADGSEIFIDTTPNGKDHVVYNGNITAIPKVNRDLICAAPHGALFIKQVPQKAANNKPWIIAIIEGGKVARFIESKLQWSRHGATGLDVNGNPVFFDSQGCFISGIDGSDFTIKTNSEFLHPSCIKNSCYFTDFKNDGTTYIVKASPDEREVQEIKLPLDNKEGHAYVSSGVDAEQGLIRFVYDAGSQCGFSEYECQIS